MFFLPSEKLHNWKEKIALMQTSNNSNHSRVADAEMDTKQYYEQ